MGVGGGGLHNPSAFNELLEATRNDNDMRTLHMANRMTHV